MAGSNWIKFHHLTKHVKGIMKYRSKSRQKIDSTQPDKREKWCNQCLFLPYAYQTYRQHLDACHRLLAVAHASVEGSVCHDSLRREIVCWLQNNEAGSWPNWALPHALFWGQKGSESFFLHFYSRGFTSGAWGGYLPVRCIDNRIWEKIWLLSCILDGLG